MTKETDVLEARHAGGGVQLRPAPNDDSNSKPLSQRMPGDAVDLYTEGGWWEVRAPEAEAAAR